MKIFALFDELLRLRGSDLHLGVGYPPLARIKGDLAPLRAEAITTDEMDRLLFEITTSAQRDQVLADKDLDFAYSYGEKARFRANYFFKSSGLAAVFRAVPTEILTLEQLGCPAIVRKLAERRSGLVLVTGPTGSGKSTTLAAMIRHINQTRACHILTIEDPVEFVHRPLKAQVTHREVGPDAGSFASAIRSAGREDPDVILIGELRDNETMKLSLQLASFGVLVFATVHTNSAPATIDRVVNAFGAEEQPQVRGMLAESLVGVVAQQLMKRADGQGRVAAQEVLVATSGLAAMIRDNKTFQIPSLMQASQGVGMQTMDMALERLVLQRLISFEVGLEKASDKDAFEKRVRANA